MKNLHVVTPLRTSFQVQSELRDRMDEVARSAHARGVEFGKKLGEQAVSRGIFLGACFGAVYGALLTLVALGWFSP